MSYFQQLVMRQLTWLEESYIDLVTCRRKLVVAAALTYEDEAIMNWSSAHNGPSRPNNQCTNEKGNCGCSHAEPRAISRLLRHHPRLLTRRGGFFMVTSFSPCTTCANIIIDSFPLGVCRAVIFRDLTLHDTRGSQFLNDAGIRCGNLAECDVSWLN